MRTHEEVRVSRDVEAVQIPFGDKIVIPAGSEVTITQALGGTFTVSTDFGYLARVDGKDADALGKEAPAAAQSSVDADTTASPKEIEEKIWDELRTVYDPEIPANVVDLGLVYGVDVSDHADGGYKIHVTMTLTAPGCGMGDVLKADAEQRVQAVQGVREAEVEMVTEPPWNQDMMSEAARLELGIF
ncbi:MAG: putative Fe-S cluster assembly protein SufT [Proteobacteria bacterium]|nr:putative Fe-S cluster assembly protein SufT [Pseudomonadota bacterium]